MITPAGEFTYDRLFLFTLGSVLGPIVVSLTYVFVPWIISGSSSGGSIMSEGGAILLVVVLGWVVGFIPLHFFASWIVWALMRPKHSSPVFAIKGFGTYGAICTIVATLFAAVFIYIWNPMPIRLLGLMIMLGASFGSGMAIWIFRR
jgi:hypothetical protein